MDSRLFLILLLIFVASCSTLRAGSVIEQGQASWYGPGFHGNRTANGEVYNQDALTAAHRTLPFNTLVQVTNLNNGQSVTVRINDRGPYARGRIIDLSREAARRIDMIEAGIAPVKLVLIESEKPLQTRGEGNIREEQFTIQLASFSSRGDAEAFSREIANSRVFVAQLNNQTVYRIYYGRYSDRAQAARALEQLGQRGLEGFIKQVQN